MNTRENERFKNRGDTDVSYLGKTVDRMVWEFMEERGIDGLTLAIVQAPYIPRVVGYGFSDARQRRLASVNTLWPAGPISQGFTAVAIMQLYEAGKIDVNAPASAHLPYLPDAWKNITVLQLLRHATGIADYRDATGWEPDRQLTVAELVGLVKDKPLAFAPGTGVALSATNFAILAGIIEAASGQSHIAYITENQIDKIGLKHTAFAENLKDFNVENLNASNGTHELFKKDVRYVDPAEPAVGNDNEGRPVPPVVTAALPGFGDVWASAQDISFWDICLAGSILISKPENRALIYTGWKLPDGKEVPAVAGWHFYRHRGLMDIKGSTPGYSVFLSRFTDASELVCVTLMCNREGIDFTNPGRRIAAAFGDLLSTQYDDNKLYLYEGQLSVADTVGKLEGILKKKNIPLFAKYDHARNAEEVGLQLRPTTVLVFGSPQVGTGLMQADQSIAVELPLRIAVWEDEAGSTWLAFPRMSLLAGEYGLQDHPVTGKIEALLEKLVQTAGNVY